MTSKAQKGDIVVFSIGFLTPEWVTEILKNYEKDLTSQKEVVQNTIVIVIDACYSGTWKTRMQQCLNAKPLDFTRIILQTSCGEDEVSYGYYFMPVFCALQDPKTRTEVMEAYKNNPDSLQGKTDELSDCTPQTPTIYDSSGASNGNELPVCHCESLWFINNSNFLTFCHKYLAIASLEEAIAREIPDDELDSFFKSFGSREFPEICCLKLKRHSSGTLQAFFLMEWDEQFYHLHLHFDSFDRMQLTGVSLVQVTEGHIYIDRYWYGYAEIDDHDAKVRINDSVNKAKWELVKRNKENMIAHCRKFVEQKTKKRWDKREDWRMQHAIPRLIRSRSAYFQDAQDAKREAQKWQNLIAFM